MYALVDYVENAPPSMDEMEGKRELPSGELLFYEVTPVSVDIALF